MKYFAEDGIKQRPNINSSGISPTGQSLVLNQ